MPSKEELTEVKATLRTNFEKQINTLSKSSKLLGEIVRENPIMPGHDRRLKECQSVVDDSKTYLMKSIDDTINAMAVFKVQ